MIKGIDKIIFWVVIFIFIVTMVPEKATAQLVPMKDQSVFVDSLRRDLKDAPFFGLYRDNYFIAGTTPNKVPSRTNSDVKFQISFALRLTNATLPGNSFLFLMYTQKTFWNVFEPSLPMGDINFNPGIGWSFPFFSKNQYVGKATLLLEHESNGRDGNQSRSWNRLSISASTIIDQWIMVHAKIWFPFIDSRNNKDILKYYGIYQSGVVITTPDQKFQFGLTWMKRAGWNLNFNTILDFTWRIHKKSNLNLFVQYYNGYGEDLLHYNQFRSMLRAGLVFKPKFFSEF